MKTDLRPLERNRFSGLARHALAALTLPASTLSAEVSALANSTPLFTTANGNSTLQIIKGAQTDPVSNLGSDVRLFRNATLTGNYPVSVKAFLLAQSNNSSQLALDPNLYDIRFGIRADPIGVNNQGGPHYLAATHATFTGALGAEDGSGLKIRELSLASLAGNYTVSNDVKNQITAGTLRIYELSGKFHAPNAFIDSATYSNALEFGVLQKYATSTYSADSSPVRFSLAPNHLGQPAIDLTMSVNKPLVPNFSTTPLEVWQAGPGTVTLWWTGTQGQLDYSQNGNTVSSSNNLTNWSNAGPIAPFQAKNRSTAGGEEFFRINYPFPKILGNSASEPIVWNGLNAFPYETGWQPVTGSPRTFTFVAIRYNKYGGAPTESPVTTVTGSGNGPYMPYNSAAPFYRAVITKGFSSSIVWEHQFAQGSAGTLTSTYVNIPSQFYSRDSRLEMQWRPNQNSPWIFGCATFSGTGNNGYGLPTRFAIPPYARVLGD